MGYLCASFSFPRPLCSRLGPALRDRQTDVRCASSLNASALWERGHNNYAEVIGLFCSIFFLFFHINFGACVFFRFCSTAKKLCRYKNMQYSERYCCCRNVLNTAVSLCLTRLLFCRLLRLVQLYQRPSKKKPLGILSRIFYRLNVLPMSSNKNMSQH